MRSSQLVCLVILGTLAIASALDVYTELKDYPEFSTIRELYKSTGVDAEINRRDSLTVLLLENGLLQGYLNSHPSYTTQMLADVLRYHVILQYLDAESLKTLNMNGGVVTTLYQTTGRANGVDGFLNVTMRMDGVVEVRPTAPGSSSQATVIRSVKAIPYKYSFVQISNVLEPIGLAAAQLAPTAPPTMVPAPAPVMEGPVSAPVEAPMESPIEAPVESPIEAPVEAPVETPVESPVETPVVSPPMPVMEGPSAYAPEGAPVSAGFALRSNGAALVACVMVAALLM